MNLKHITLFLLLSILTMGCLKTRSQVSEYEQSMIYRKKHADNQKEDATAALSSKPSKEETTGNIEQDEMIRKLNGRVEELENEITVLKKEKDAQLAEIQKLSTYQENYVKIENELAALKAEKQPSAAENKKKSSDDNIKVPVTTKTTASKSTYDTAEDYFSQKEWKKAIVSYQKYIDENQKSKNVPEAKYKTGVCFQELGLKDEALAFYEEVALQYPQSLSGKKAKTRIAKLKKK